MGKLIDSAHSEPHLKTGGSESYKVGKEELCQEGKEGDGFRETTDIS